ncbi:histidine phosphatase superfamily protein, clade-2 [Kipferlia bialata]|uniref:Histidine phosphatase superfamily protein, clade-2 n=1 Tax=Kipferlia bialata TaxID=797122 RepID=A0A9K3CU86_9EUKA|nr:histidine phosphatase superfamily protein, clade-2 [Kipferlia bialata]|eukprot:g3306.t1
MGSESWAQKYTPEFALVVTRHGARSTLHPFPTEPDQWHCDLNYLMMYADGDAPIQQPLYMEFFYDNGLNALPGTCMLGELTPVGRDQELVLGQFYRSRYIDDLGLIPSSMDPSLLYLRSTDVQRTKESLMAQLNGLYPDSARQHRLHVHTGDSTYDDMIPQTARCPRMAEIYDNITQEQFYQDYQASIQPEMDSICGKIGGSMDWVPIYDNLMARNSSSMGLPFGITEHEYQTSIDAADFEMYAQFYRQTEYLQLYIGMFVHEITQMLLAAADGELPFTFAMHSGHDSTVSPLMGVLQDWDYTWPPYASVVAFELWTDQTGAYYVKSRFIDSDLRPPFCGGLVYCPLDTFVAGMEVYALPDVDTYLARCAGL